MVCPVCRETLTYDLDLLLSSPAPQLPEVKRPCRCLQRKAERGLGLFLPPQFHGEAFGADFQQKWEELQRILEKQRSKGGIIDPEVESNRFLIHINEVRPDSDAELLQSCGRRCFQEENLFLMRCQKRCGRV